MKSSRLKPTPRRSFLALFSVFTAAFLGARVAVPLPPLSRAADEPDARPAETQFAPEISDATRFSSDSANVAEISDAAPIAPVEPAATSGSSFLDLIQRSEWSGRAVYAAQASNADGVRSGIDGAGRLDLDWTLPFSETDQIFCSVRSGVGAGLDGRVATFAGFNGNGFYDGSPELQLYQFYYRKDWSGGKEKFSTTFGYIDITNAFDTNAYANDETTQFLACNLINNLSFEFVRNGLGGYAWWKPNDKLALGIGWHEIDDATLDLFSDGVLVAEISRRVDWNGRIGNYRFDVWSNFWERRRSDSGVVDDDNLGWGLSFDQDLTRYFGAFVRFGTQDGACCDHERSLTFGGEIHQFNPARPDDRIGLGFGRTFLNDDVADPSFGPTEDERNVELYYSFGIGERFALTPSLQYVDAPAGDASAKSIWAPGLRANVHW